MYTYIKVQDQKNNIFADGTLFFRHTDFHPLFLYGCVRMTKNLFSIYIHRTCDEKVEVLQPYPLSFIYSYNVYVLEYCFI